MHRNPQSHAQTPHELSAPHFTRVPRKAKAAGQKAEEIVLENGITEAIFLTRFPAPFSVRAMSVFEADAQGFTPDRTYWHYEADFTYVSDRFGTIVIPKGFITDFASVPPKLRSFYDDDSPILLYPSGPHDLLFKPLDEDTAFGKKGERGWLPDGSKRLSLSQTNTVLTEAMWYCGASETARTVVYDAVQLANLGIQNEFAPEPG
jgi:hypothetical protein